MKSTRRVVLVAAALLAVVTALATTMRQDSPASLSPMAQGYPTATTEPTETPTPTPDAQGYMPPPTNITTTLVTLGASPYADLLVPLQAALDAQDLTWLSDTASWRGSLPFVPIGCLDGGDACGSPQLDTPDELAPAVATAIAGTNALIQGYFEEPGGDGQGVTWTCLQVLIYPFGTTMTYPTAIPGPPGPETNPSTVTVDASAIEVCKKVDSWGWDAWRFGGYHEIVDTFAFNGATNYAVVRP